MICSINTSIPKQVRYDIASLRFHDYSETMTIIPIHFQSTAITLNQEPEDDEEDANGDEKQEEKQHEVDALNSNPPDHAPSNAVHSQPQRQSGYFSSQNFVPPADSGHFRFGIPTEIQCPYPCTLCIEPLSMDRYIVSDSSVF